MPDTILSVEFTSEGARAGAPAGSYPIVPSSIRFSGSARVRYSLRYVPGTMAVGSSSPIAFVRKDQHGESDPLAGGIEWEMAVQPATGNTIVLIVSTLAFDGGGGGVAPAFTTPTNGTGTAYAQVGGSGYQAEFQNPLGVNDFVLAMFTLKCDSATANKTVKITIADPGMGFTDLQLVALEYTNVSPVAVSEHAKAEVSDPAPDVRPVVLPAIDLNGTAGQALVAAFVGVGTANAGNTYPATPSGYVGRYGVSDVVGSPDLDGIDLLVIDRVGLSGVGPLTVSVNWTPGSTGRHYSGIGIALTR